MSETKRRRPRSRANGEGSVYPIRDGRFRAQVVIGWTDDRRPRYARRTVATAKEGRAWIGEVKAALAEGLEIPDDRRTVGAWLDEWIAGLPGTVSEGTIRVHRDRTRLYVKPSLGEIPLRRLTPRRVSTWLRELRDRGYSASTCHGAYSTLRRAVTVAQQEGLVARNVVAIADGPRSDGRTARWVTAAEVSKLLDATTAEHTGRGRPANSERLGVAVTVLAGTGLRRGELLGLTWSALDLDAKQPTLTVRQQLVRRGDGLVLADTKTGRIRTIPLAGFVVDALRAHRRAQAAERLAAGSLWQEHDLVICGEDGRPVDPRNLGKALERLAKRAGLAHVNPHALRHGAVSVLLANGVPLEVASEIAGHSSIRVTKDVYGHLATHHLAIAASAMDRAFAR